MFEIGSAIARIKADTSDFQRGIETVTGQTNGLGAVMGKLGGIIATVFAVKKIVEFGQASLEASGKFEQVAIAFNTMLGSVEKGKKLFEDLKEFAKVTPFNFEGLADTTKRLLAYGVAQDKIIPTLRTLGDIASGVGMEKLPQLTLAFGQVKAMGRLTGMELRQFSEAGVPLLETLAKQSKKTTAEITDMISNQEVSFEMVQQALSSMNSEGGKFFGLMDAQSKTMLGSLSNLQDSWMQLKAVIGDIFRPIATQLITDLTGIINNVKAMLEGTNNLNTVWNQLAMTWSTIQVYLQPLIDWITIYVIPVLQSLWSEFMYFVNAVVPPVVAISLFLYNSLVEIFTNLYNFWSRNWDSIKAILTGTWNFIVGFLQYNFAFIAGIFVVFLNLITGNWQGAWDAVKHYGEMAWNGIKNMFNGIISFISGWGGLLLRELVRPFEDAWNRIRDLVNKIKDALDFTKRHSPSVVDIVERGVGLVNKAFDDLKVGIQPIDTSRLAFAGASGGLGGMNPIINIDLAGAYISDDSIGEKIGDAIISKLAKTVRF